MTIYTVIGLMAGTSLDGVDVALIKTDGQNFVERLGFQSYPYADDLRAQVRSCFGLSTDLDGRLAKAEKMVTDAHIAAVKASGFQADLIGFHGQTIFHDPANRMTWQIGDGQRLADECGMDVVYDFRSADVQAGGQGAPLLPLYHQVLAKSTAVEMPVAILNIGGVANITWIGKGENEVVAFDTGPGNALIDDWMLKQSGRNFDENGTAALAGIVNEAILHQALSHPYFKAPIPKSLDRDAFKIHDLQSLNLNDGAATLATFTVEAIVKAFALLPEKTKALYVTGGGRHNDFIMQHLAERLSLPVRSVDALGWNGDAMEAEGFAYLAVRSKLGLPLSLPTTTNCPAPMTGGKLSLTMLSSAKEQKRD